MCTLLNISYFSLIFYLKANNLYTKIMQSKTIGQHARLRTFARKFSTIDFFLKILPLKDDELAMSEM